MLSITSRWSRKRSSAPRRRLVERESGVDRAPESEGGQQPRPSGLTPPAVLRPYVEPDHVRDPAAEAGEAVATAMTATAAATENLSVHMQATVGLLELSG